MRAVDTKISVLKIRLGNLSPVGNIFKDRSVKSALADLHSKFVFCPTDKAANNIAIVCKHLYAKVILDELNSNTYTRVNNLDEETIVKKHLDFHSYFNIDLPSSMQKLPPLHWTPKIYKNPTGSQFSVHYWLKDVKYQTPR